MNTFYDNLLKIKDHIWMYVFIWTSILSLSVFAIPIAEWNCESIMGDNAFKGCMLPMGFITCLYLWEEIWNTINRNIKSGDMSQTFILTLLLLTAIIVFMIFANLCAENEQTITYFILIGANWILISLLKYISVSMTRFEDAIILNEV